MTGILWLLLFAIAAALGWLIWHNMRKWQARRRAEEERFANFMAGTAGAPAPKAAAPSSAPLPTLPATAPSTATGDNLALQKLLFDSAHKAGEAGEPSLAIQLYARLLSRYPSTGFAAQVRAEVEAQKKKLAKA